MAKKKKSNKKGNKKNTNSSVRANQPKTPSITTSLSQNQSSSSSVVQRVKLDLRTLAQDKNEVNAFVKIFLAKLRLPMNLIFMVYNRINEAVEPFKVILEKPASIDPLSVMDAFELFREISKFYDICYGRMSNIDDDDEFKQFFISRIYQQYYHVVRLMLQIELLLVENRPDFKISFPGLTSLMLRYVYIGSKQWTFKQEEIASSVNHLMDTLPSKMAREKDERRFFYESIYYGYKAAQELLKDNYDLNEVSRCVGLSEHSYKLGLRQSKIDHETWNILQALPYTYSMIGKFYVEHFLFEEAILWIQDSISMNMFLKETAEQYGNLTIIGDHSILDDRIAHAKYFINCLREKNDSKKGDFLSSLDAIPVSVSASSRCLTKMEIMLAKDDFDEMHSLLRNQKYQYSVVEKSDFRVRHFPSYSIQLDVRLYTYESLEKIISHLIKKNAEREEKLRDSFSRRKLQAVEVAPIESPPESVAVETNIESTPVEETAQILENNATDSSAIEPQQTESQSNLSTMLAGSGLRSKGDQTTLSAEKAAKLERHLAKLAEKEKLKAEQKPVESTKKAVKPPPVKREIRWNDARFEPVTSKNRQIEYMEIYRQKRTFLLFAPGIFDDGHMEDKVKGIARTGRYLSSKLSKGRQGLIKYNPKKQSKTIKKQDSSYNWKFKLQGVDERPIGYVATEGYVYENGVKKENEKVELVYIDKVIKRGHS